MSFCFDPLERGLMSNAERNSDKAQPGRQPSQPSMWLDSLNPKLLCSNRCRRLIKERCLCIASSNPASFGQALSDSEEYTGEIRRLAHHGTDAEEIYRFLTIRDAQRAADLLYPVYQQTDGRNGWVSIEVSPDLAYDTEGMLEEARAVWQALQRPNGMLQIYGTPEAVPVIRELVADGVNTNVTCILTVPRYHDVVGAYIAGLEARNSRELPLKDVTSFATFRLGLLQRVFCLLLDLRSGDERLEMEPTVQRRFAAITAKVFGRTQQQMFRHGSFRRLSSRGAQAQVPLWVKDSARRSGGDVLKSVEVLTPATAANASQSTDTDPEPALFSTYENLLRAEQVVAGAAVAPADMALLDEAEEEIIKENVLCIDHAIEELERKRALALR